jgi:UDP-N-acetyl-2-amino-2-deoxyglucuronate dehydrogenase
MKTFVLTGAAGYVAPKHMRAIHSVDGRLVACLDPHDSIGVIDSYFPQAYYFSEFERFDRYCSKLGSHIDYVSIASPNYLHDAHCRFGMRIGADVICEKPAVLSEKNLDELLNMEVITGQKVNTILQLRLSPILTELKQKIGTRHKVFLEYYTPRGNWYLHSWKGDVSKSGGLATNIGIHLFDLMVWLFGPEYDKPEITVKTPTTVSGFLNLTKASVSFDLSIEKGPQRRLIIDNQEIEFSKGFTDLHNESYKRILNGEGFDLEMARPSIKICEQIRNLT